MRLPLATTIQSRDGTLAKGAQLKNVLVEAKGDTQRIFKRPGASVLLSLGTTLAQGAIAFGGAVYVVENDVLRKVILSPASAGPTYPL